MNAGWEAWPLCPECKVEEPYCTGHPVVCDECEEEENDCMCRVGLHEIEDFILPVCGGPQKGCSRGLCRYCVRGVYSFLPPGWVACETAKEHILRLFHSPFETDTDYIEYVKAYRGPIRASEQTIVNHAALENVLCVSPCSYMPPQFRVLQCRTTNKILILSSGPTTQ